MKTYSEQMGGLTLIKLNNLKFGIIAKFSLVLRVNIEYMPNQIYTRVKKNLK